MNKSILITGSSRGIGKSIALSLAGLDYELVLHCRSNIAQVNVVKSQIEAQGTQCRVLQFDVSDRELCREVIEADIEANGAYYGVVCNAGIARDGAFPALTGEDWDVVVHTNLDAFYNVLQPLVMPMIRRRAAGRIVTLSSVSGLIGNRGQTNYSASKGGLIAASKSLAIELAKRKITVNCVAPGLIETEMTEEVVSKEAMDMIPARRFGKPEEVAALVRFLLSSDASYITRQVISVNGGIC